MEIFISVCLGLGLAAACGFRIFVPLLLLNLAARTEYLTLSPSFEWIGSTPALIAFALATVLEIGAYYVPWLDHMLDTVAGPAAVVAGIVVSASVITGIDPFLKWTLAAIAGGGVAGAIQMLTSGTRGLSGLVTGGLGNPLVSSAELAGALVLSLLAILVPVAALVAVAALLFVAARRFFARRRPAPA